MKNEKLKYEKIYQLVQGELEDCQAKEVLEWIDKDEETKKRYHQLKRDYAMSGQSDNISYERLSQLYKEIKPQPKILHNQSKRWLPEMMKYAAIFIIALTVGYCMFSEDPLFTEASVTYISYETGDRQTSKVNLPDGSFVQLNSNSKLEVPNQFGMTDSRQIRLTGEAYFDVKHIKNKPFSIHTSKGIVKVLGTTFNVEAYDNEKMITTLVTGKVELQNTENNKTIVLEPSQQSIINAEGQVEIKTLNALAYVSWKEGYLTFNQTTLKSIIPKIERFYGIKLLIENKQLLDKEINGKAFRHVAVDKLFKVLQETYDINYKISVEGETVDTVTLF